MYMDSCTYNTLCVSTKPHTVLQHSSESDDVGQSQPQQVAIKSFGRHGEEAIKQPAWGRGNSRHGEDGRVGMGKREGLGKRVRTCGKVHRSEAADSHKHAGEVIHPHSKPPSASQAQLPQLGVVVQVLMEVPRDHALFPVRLDTQESLYCASCEGVQGTASFNDERGGGG